MKWIQEGKQINFNWTLILSQQAKWHTQRCHNGHFPRHCQKTQKWAEAQFLEISIPPPK